MNNATALLAAPNAHVLGFIAERLTALRDGFAGSDWSLRWYDTEDLRAGISCLADAVFAADQAAEGQIDPYEASAHVSTARRFLREFSEPSESAAMVEIEERLEGLSFDNSMMVVAEQLAQMARAS